MKLPTLNVDVKVNTSTLQKDVERANKQIQQIGGKALSFAGGMGGKIGALGSLGGTAGTMAIGFGTAVAGFAALDMIQQSFVASMKEAETAVKSFAETGKTGGMNIVAARVLAAQSAQMSEQQKRGMFAGVTESFMAGAQGPGGNIIEDFIQYLSQGARFGAGIAGGVLSGRDIGDVYNRALAMSMSDQTSAEFVAGPQDLASAIKLAMLQSERQRKDQREQNT